MRPRHPPVAPQSRLCGRDRQEQSKRSSSTHRRECLFVVDTRYLREALRHESRLILHHLPIGIGLHLEDPFAPDSLSAFAYQSLTSLERGRRGCGVYRSPSAGPLWASVTFCDALSFDSRCLVVHKQEQDARTHHVDVELWLGESTIIRDRCEWMDQNVGFPASPGATMLRPSALLITSLKVTLRHLHTTARKEAASTYSAKPIRPLASPTWRNIRSRLTPEASRKPRGSCT
jgi:hypothetical protein